MADQFVSSVAVTGGFGIIYKHDNGMYGLYACPAAPMCPEMPKDAKPNAILHSTEEKNVVLLNKLCAVKPRPVVMTLVSVFPNNRSAAFARKSLIVENKKA